MSLVAALGLTVPAQAGGGCSASRCVPRTGIWTAPSPQKLPYDSLMGPSAIRVKVLYLNARGREARSAYGNAITIQGFRVRYVCPKGADAAYVEAGVGAWERRLDRKGVADFTVDSATVGPQHVHFAFTREAARGSMSGIMLSPGGGRAAVSFYLRYTRAK